jgi:autotransporter-associated beta strand protein
MNANSTTMFATKTNTLIQVTSGTAQQLSNGHGDILVGRTGQDGDGPATISIRRGLVEFNPAAAVPAGATITGVTLAAELLSSAPSNENVALGRMLRDWGQGTSLSRGASGALATTGDATWYYPFYGSAGTWTAPGGKAGVDYGASISAATLIPAGGPGQSFSWSNTANPALVTDVQQWLDRPAANFGWIMLGDESTGFTAKIFGGQYETTPNSPPQLSVQYLAPWTWSGSGSNSAWTTAGNWANSGGYPPGGAAIVLGDSHSTCGTVDLGSAAPSVSHLTFDADRIMTITDSIAGGGHLTLDNGVNPVAIVVSGSGHTIDSTVAVALDSDVWINTAGSGDSLKIAGNMANGTAPHGLVKQGAGTLLLSGSNTYSGGTAVNDGTLVVASARSIADGSSLSIGGDTWLFNSSSASAPVELSTIAMTAVPEPGSCVSLAMGVLLAALAASCWKNTNRPVHARLRS